MGHLILPDPSLVIRYSDGNTLSFDSIRDMIFAHLDSLNSSEFRQLVVEAAEMIPLRSKEEWTARKRDKV